MKLTLAEPRLMKESITVISDLVNEASFKITPEAMELVAMDPANVAMVVFKLFSSTFTEYDVSSQMELAINLTNLRTILRRAKPNDMLTLELGEDNKLKILLKGSSTRTFSLPIIELDEKEQKIPDLSFACTVETSSSTLNEAVEDADIVAESVQFLGSSDKLTLQADGDLSNAKIEIPSNDITKINITGDAKVKSKYSIEYLKKMINGSKLADEVKMSFSSDYPLKLEYKVIDKLLLSFILAPICSNCCSRLSWFISSPSNVLLHFVFRHKLYFKFPK